MLKKFTLLSAIVMMAISVSFAQEKVEVQPHDVVLKVVFANDEVGAKLQDSLGPNKVFKGESNSIYYLRTTKDASSKAQEEVEAMFQGVEMKINKMSGEDYLKASAKNK